MSDTETETTLAPDATCQEASRFCTDLLFIPCGKPAVCIVQSARAGEPALPMCRACGYHSVKNRGFRYVVEPRAEPEPEPTMEPQQTALTLIETTGSLSTLFAEPGWLTKTLQRIAAESREQAARLDISTEKNRKAIKSLRFKIARSKTMLDDAGKDLKAEWKRRSDAIDGDRRLIRDELDALAKEIEAPVLEYEAAEKAIDAANEAEIARIEALAVGLDALSSSEIVARYKEITDYDYHLRFRARADRATQQTVETLRAAHKTARDREKAAEAERERLVAEVETARKAEHNAAINKLEAAAKFEDDYLPLWFHRRLDWLDRAYADRDWQDFAEAAGEAYRTARTTLTTRLDELTAAEAAAQEQREREAADAARRDAEERAARDAEQAAQAAAAREAELAARLEATRVDALKAALAAMRKLAEPLTATPVLAIVEQRIGALDELYAATDWQETTNGAALIWKECHALLDAQRGAALQAMARADAARIAAHEAAIAAIAENPEWGKIETSTEIKRRLNYLSTVLGLRDWEEYQDRAYQAVDAEINRIGPLLADAERREAEERAAALRQREDAARIMADAADRGRREKNVADRWRVVKEIAEDVAAAMTDTPTGEWTFAITEAIIAGNVRHVKVEW